MAKRRTKKTSDNDPYRIVLDESKARPVRVNKIPVLTYKHDWKSDAPTLTMPGTITVFVAKAGSKVLKQVRSAVEGGPRQLRTLQQALKQQFGSGRKLSSKEAAKEIVEADVFAEVRYGGATLHKGIILPKGIKVFPLVLPYNGGRLAKGGFSLAEYHRDGSREALEAVIVRNSPPLTRAERAALRQVPADQLVQNVGNSMDCETTYWAVAVVVLDAAAAVATIALAQCGKPELDDFLHVSQKEIDRLGPAASARELLDLRRKEIEAITG